MKGRWFRLYNLETQEKCSIYSFTGPQGVWEKLITRDNWIIKLGSRLQALRPWWNHLDILMEEELKQLMEQKTPCTNINHKHISLGRFHRHGMNEHCKGKCWESFRCEKCKRTWTIQF